MHITGNNFSVNKKFSDHNDSYFFSSVPSIWGWATWRRAWKHYDVAMKDFPEFVKRKKIKEIFKSKSVQRFWLVVFRKNYKSRDDSWDWPWCFALFNKKGLVVTPKTNLVSNIGFDSLALHTKDSNNRLAHLPIKPLEFPLLRQEPITVNKRADGYFNRYVLDINFLNYFFKKILKTIGLFNIVKALHYRIKKIK